MQFTCNFTKKNWNIHFLKNRNLSIFYLYWIVFIRFVLFCLCFNERTCFCVCFSKDFIAICFSYSNNYFYISIGVRTGYLCATKCENRKLFSKNLSVISGTTAQILHLFVLVLVHCMINRKRKFNLLKFLKKMEISLVVCTLYQRGEGYCKKWNFCDLFSHFLHSKQQAWKEKHVNISFLHVDLCKESQNRK